MYNYQVLEEESITGDIFLWFGGGRDKVFLISYSCKNTSLLVQNIYWQNHTGKPEGSGKDFRDKRWLYKYYYDSFSFSPEVLFSKDTGLMYSTSSVEDTKLLSGITLELLSFFIPQLQLFYTVPKHCKPLLSKRPIASCLSMTEWTLPGHSHGGRGARGNFKALLEPQ